MHIYQLKTSRLLLRQWQKTDLPTFIQLNADSEVMRYFPNLLTAEESIDLAERFKTIIAQNGWGFWAVELKATGQFIGFVGLNAQPDKFSFSPCVEIGWRIASEFWHQGYATEAAHACLNFAFHTLKLKEIVSFTAKQNQPSKKVMQRLAMKFSHSFDHPALNNESPLQQHVLYKINDEQFSTLKNINGHYTPKKSR
ncbi:GNAT family N-acetyltransferase [Acinetobacter silvestris]|uniref:GNAT family N-acetyltransferase n=1 Tax=Acinetobacter silvestris TaxID=1977882 RepID=A0A1Y3CE79_9GAMM|nr:GNAT family N-acetyltransferase [Acinetobacter silvestris]OTG65408.1 GNAT family N-acetyltransferase [Acinetobacter silvestris]